MKKHIYFKSGITLSREDQSEAKEKLKTLGRSYDNVGPEVKECQGFGPVVDKFTIDNFIFEIYEYQAMDINVMSGSLGNETTRYLCKFNKY